jgi:hypothetical protein
MTLLRRLYVDHAGRAGRHAARLGQRLAFCCHFCSRRSGKRRGRVDEGGLPVPARNDPGQGFVATGGLDPTIAVTIARVMAADRGAQETYGTQDNYQSSHGFLPFLAWVLQPQRTQRTRRKCFYFVLFVSFVVNYSSGKTGNFIVWWAAW